MTSTITTNLKIPSATEKGNQAHMFPNLKSGNLLSVGQLCDDGYKVTFTNRKVTFTKNNETKFEGNRNQTNGMWMLQFPDQKANYLIPLKPIGDAIRFMHAACFSPCVSTWCQAIDAGFFKHWPALTAKRVRQFIKINPPPTVKGHLAQERQHLRSTKQNNNIEQQRIDEPSNAAYIKIEEAPPRTLSNRKIYSDLTGKFPQKSNKGNQYIFILYDTTSNHIFAEPIKDRTSTHIQKAYTKITTILNEAGISPTMHILDNESSKTYAKLIRNNQQTKIQFVPPYMHRRNIAERAIRTFKAHFIAGLCSTDKDFPLNLWDRLLPQCQMTLNMLRPSHATPTISAYEHIFGQYDLQKTPIAPPGIKAIVHLKPNQRTTFGPRGLDCWYIGPCMEHYRCLKFYTTLGGERISDTAMLYPNNLSTPQWTNLDAVLEITQNLEKVINKKQRSPHSLILEEQQMALKQLSDIFSTFTSNNAQKQRRVTEQPITQHETRVSANTNTMPTYAEPRVNKQKLQLTAYPNTNASDANVNHHQKQESKQPSQKTIHMGNLVQEIFLQPENEAANSMHMQECNAIIDPKTGASLEYRHLIKDDTTKVIWNKSFSNELGRLANGVGNRVKGTNTIKFIPKSEVPKGRKVTYGRIVVDFRPTKSEPNRTRLTVGGDKIDYPGPVRTDTADMLTAKQLLNSVVSTPRARCCILDIKDFYLNNLLPRYEYMRMALKLIPQDIVEEYNLHAISHDGYVYFQIEKGMYGLPQAGKIANEELQQHLLPFGYKPCPRTPGLWSHTTRPISFALVVDDFAVKYVKKEDLNHLLRSLQSKYTITIDNNATQFCGIQLTWDYRKRKVTLSMPGYVDNLLHKLQHPKPTKPEYNPHTWKPPKYGETAQYVETPPQLPILPPARIRRIQQVIGSLLYYARAVDHTILVTVNDIAAQQSKATSETEAKVIKLLNYIATNPNATLTYHQSKMQLVVHSDASYLSAPNARSRAGGYFFLSTDTPTSHLHPLNAPMHVECKIMKNVLSSATEAEIGAIFLNCQQAEIIRTTLEELGHPQNTTTIVTDNATANNIINGNAKQKRTKAMDMRYNWILDRQVQRHFQVIWRPGKDNLADYFTKHHSTVHHKRVRSIYVT